MLEKLKARGAHMSWVGGAPSGENKFVLLIPEYNEGSHCDLQARLAYFKNVSAQFSDVLDVVIIDDGSNDGSLEAIRSFKEEHDALFYISAVYPNANKVGALYLTVLAIKHEFVILSDFDTDIQGMEVIFNKAETFRDDLCTMGCYFRMLPFEGGGGVFLFQQLEYSMARAFYKFHAKERSVPVMPGAGCCYKREVLEKIYNIHSGLRSGEDREATLLGLQLGYKTLYVDNILTLTRPPLSFRSLVKQRVRWNLGYLETFYKEKKYYYAQITKLSRIGIRTIIDLICVKFVLLIPVFILFGLIANWKLLVAYLVGIYFTCVIWSVNAILIAPKESIEFKSKRLNSILCYPFYKVSLDCIAWISALICFIGKR